MREPDFSEVWRIKRGQDMQEKQEKMNDSVFRPELRSVDVKILSWKRCLMRKQK